MVRGRRFDSNLDDLDATSFGHLPPYPPDAGRPPIGPIRPSEMSSAPDVPVLVVSVDALRSAIGLAMVCAITMHGSGGTGARNDLEVPIPPGMAATGVVLPHEMQGIDMKASNATKLCTLPRTTCSPSGRA